VPVTAVIVFTVTLLWLPQHDNQISGLQTAATSAKVIASYQDDPVIIISAAGTKRPGIGFFNTAPTIRKPFSPVTIVFNQDTLDIQWPDVQQATQYQVQISVYRGADAEPILNQTTATSIAHFDHFNPESGHRYEWTISGVTLNNATFKANGGFVIQ
jgi:hypothetical protein